MVGSDSMATTFCADPAKKSPRIHSTNFYSTVVMYSSTALQHKCSYKLLFANLDNCNELKACFMIYKGILAIARFGS